MERITIISGNKSRITIKESVLFVWNNRVIFFAVFLIVILYLFSSCCFFLHSAMRVKMEKSLINFFPSTDAVDEFCCLLVSLHRFLMFYDFVFLFCLCRRLLMLIYAFIFSVLNKLINIHSATIVYLL